jgi:hypothetical protein
MHGAMREELELNRAHWDEATRIHTRSNAHGRRRNSERNRPSMTPS